MSYYSNFHPIYGVRAWANTAQESEAIERLHYGHKVTSVTFDICGYIYRLSPSQLEISYAH